MRTSIIVITALLLGACAPSWRGQLRRGNFVDACVLAEESVGDDGLQRAANERVSREYTASLDVQARVEEVRTVEGADLDGHLLREQYRIIRLSGPDALTLRAWVDDELVWLTAEPAAVRAVLIEAVGLRLADRSAPLAQAAAERVDKKVRRFSSGAVDPKLRRKEFGAVPECRKGVEDCSARRRTFNALDRAFARAAECSGAACERLYVARRSWESMGFPGARLQVSWNIDQCPLTHFVDVEADRALNATDLGRTWMRVSPQLTRCTLEQFAADGCAASRAD